MTLKNMLIENIYHPVRWTLYWLYMQAKIKRIRKKEQIKVLFIISEVSSWKTELLYLEMMKHPRFEPVLGVSTYSAVINHKAQLIEYLKSKGYSYNDLDIPSESIRTIHPDIIIYYKPYEACYSKGHYFNRNLRYVFCGMDYCFNISKNPIHMQRDLYEYCWQYYAENVDVAKRKKEVLGVKAKNVRVTGIPTQDILLSPRTEFEDPWKDKSGKVRIIYAPHHSFKGTNGAGIEYATFLDLGEPILELAQKYTDKVHFAFKPHPLLYEKLIRQWGKERTDAYYKKWLSLENAQVETGEYIGLFKYSDAIIHDSSSFLIEYMFMDKPSMYLVADTNSVDDMLPYAQEAFGCYEHATKISEVEEFVSRVINKEDCKQAERGKYIQKHLLPPGGKTACENIIDAILYAR